MVEAQQAHMAKLGNDTDATKMRNLLHSDGLLSDMKVHPLELMLHH